MIRIIFALTCVTAIMVLAMLLWPAGRDQLRDIKTQFSFQRYQHSISGGHLLADTMIAMPDGPRLATDVYLPLDPATDLPTILVRLPYGKQRYNEVRHWVDLFLPHGFAVVVQDMRGRWGSEGVFAPYPNAAQDGAATLDWIVDQDWSNGRVGTIGCSALGESQILLAASRHPAHRAMIPIGAGGAIGRANGDFGFFGFFEGGIPALASVVGWFGHFGGKTPDAMNGPHIAPETILTGLPFRDAVAKTRSDKTDFETMLDWFSTPDRFDDWGYITDSDRFAVPTLMVDAWYDQAVQSALGLANLIAKSAPSVKTIIAPGTHCDPEGAFSSGKLGDMPVLGAAGTPLDETYLAFMAHHLMGAAPPDLPSFSTYVMGEDRWLKTAHWPPEQAVETSLFLSGQRLEIGAPTISTVASRSFTSDPTHPVPTIGGAICCTGDPSLRTGPLFQNPIEDRTDILLFTSDPIDEPMRIAGPLSADLYISADVQDTDLVVRLTDVDPTGQSLMIQEGALRLRYRDGFDAPTLMRPGQIYKASVRMRDIAWLVRPGHRLRLHIAGSSFPRLSLNMNGGGDPHRETQPHPARIAIHMSPDAPSSVHLFTLPQ